MKEGRKRREETVNEGVRERSSIVSLTLCNYNIQSCKVSFYCTLSDLSIFLALGCKHRASYMLGDHCTTKVYFQPPYFYLFSLCGIVDWIQGELTYIPSPF